MTWHREKCTILDAVVPGADRTEPAGRRQISGCDVWMALAGLAGAILLIFAATQAQAQTFSVIHYFTGGPDGANPIAGLTLDRGGNLYGTASLGGNSSEYCAPTCGTVFKMSHVRSGWVLSPLYQFHGTDGGGPDSRPIFGPDGTLYGTAGVVYNLRPPPNRCNAITCVWNETVIYQSCCGLSSPGGLSFGPNGFIYGTDPEGGLVNHCSGGLGCGLVYEVVPSGSGWIGATIYRFMGTDDGAHPTGGVVADSSGDLYGTTAGLYGGDGLGTVFKLTQSGGGWTETTLYSFQGGSDGEYPVAGLIFDQAGNLYGATANAGTANGGTVFEFTSAYGSWNFNLLYSLSGTGVWQSGVIRNLIMDSTGNLYGATVSEGRYSMGNVFKLTPSNGAYSYTDLHDFTGGSDGAFPQGNLRLDSSGNLYGTASEGGNTGSHCAAYANYQCGTVWEITP